MYYEIQAYFLYLFPSVDASLGEAICTFGRSLPRLLAMSVGLGMDWDDDKAGFAKGAA